MKQQNKLKILYDSFHKKTSIQRKVISKKNFTYRHIVNLFNTYSSNFHKGNILDIGCGAGTICFYLAYNFAVNVKGIDISPNAIKQCKKSAQYLQLSNVDFKICNFPDELPKGKYDLIILSEVLEHIHNDNKAIKAASSLLKKNGILIITTPSINAPLYKLGWLQEFDKRVGHLRRYSEESLKQLAETNGFKVLEIKRSEGIFRNFLFTNSVAGKSIRFFKSYLSDLVTFIDLLSLKLFGESNIVLIARNKK